MTGEYKHVLDSKNRLFIPARMRDEAGCAVYITISADKCLNGYGEKAWNALTDRINSMPFLKQRKMRPVFANASRCELDSQGRIVVPAALKGYAGIEKNVTIIGCGNRFEIWNSDTWSQCSSHEIQPENIAAVMEELNF